MLFAKHFLFFPPVESALISFGHLSYGGFYYMQGGRHSRPPPAPPQAFSTKMWKKPEPKKWVNIPQGRKGALAPLHKKNMAKQMIVAKIQKSYLVSPQPTYFYITDFVRSTHWLYPPTRFDFWLIMALKFSYRFLLSVFCFRFYMTDFVRSTHWFYSPTWIDFWLFVALKSN